MTGLHRVNIDHSIAWTHHSHTTYIRTYIHNTKRFLHLKLHPINITGGGLKAVIINILPVYNSLECFI